MKKLLILITLLPLLTFASNVKVEELLGLTFKTDKESFYNLDYTATLKIYKSGKFKIKGNVLGNFCFDNK